MPAQTPGLSKAYAVLRQLERLRAQDIVDPVLPVGPPSSAPAKRLTAPAAAAATRQSLHVYGDEGSSYSSGTSSVVSGPSAPSEAQPASGSSSASDSIAAPQPHRYSSPGPTTVTRARSHRPEGKRGPQPIVTRVERVSHSGAVPGDRYADHASLRELLYSRQGNAAARCCAGDSDATTERFLRDARDRIDVQRTEKAHKARRDEQRKKREREREKAAAAAAANNEFFDYDPAQAAAALAASVEAQRQISLPYREEASERRRRSQTTRDTRETRETGEHHPKPHPRHGHGADPTTSSILDDTASSIRSYYGNTLNSSGLTDMSGIGFDSNVKSPSVQRRGGVPTGQMLSTTQPPAPSSSSSSSSNESASIANVESFLASDGGEEEQEPAGLITAPSRTSRIQSQRPVQAPPPPPPPPLAASVGAAAVLEDSPVSPPSSPERDPRSGTRDPSRCRLAADDGDDTADGEEEAEEESKRLVSLPPTGERRQELVLLRPSVPRAPPSPPASKAPPPQPQDGGSAQGTPPPQRPPAPPVAAGINESFSPPPRLQPPQDSDDDSTAAPESPQPASSPPPRERPRDASHSHRQSRSRSGRRSGSGHGGRRRSSPPPPAGRPSPQVPLLAYAEELAAAGPATLGKELAAMAATCGDDASADCLADCLALTVLANQRRALRRAVVPLLVERLLRSCGPEFTKAHDGNDKGSSDAATVDTAVYPRGARTSPMARTSPAASAALCALIGLGDVAAEALPVLMGVLRRREAGADPRLVAMAVRSVGGEAGLRALEALGAGVESDGEASEAEVRCAALYGLGTMPYSVLGHTTVLCAPSGGGGAGGAAALEAADLCFYDEPAPADGLYAEVVAVEGATTTTTDGAATATLVTEWRRMDAVTSPAALPSSLQARPPYRVTHVVCPTAALCSRLAELLTSEAAHPPRDDDYPGLVIVLRDFFRYCTHRQQPFSPAVTQSLVEATAQLGPFLATVEASIAEPSSLTVPLLLLPYSYDGYWGPRSPDATFGVERALLDAMVDCPASAVKEQALVAMASLPPRVRPHLGQPVLDFTAAYRRSFEQRWGTGPAAGEAGAVEWHAAADNDGIPTARDSGDDVDSDIDPRERAEEAVLVAAAVAVGYTAVCDGLGFAGMALEQQARQLLLGLFESNRWRVRHAACVGLGALGAGSFVRPPTPHASKMTVSSKARPSSISPCTRREGADAAARTVAAALRDGLGGGRIAPKTACWALVRQGRHGIHTLLSLLTDAALHDATHVAVAEALGRADVPGAASVSAVDGTGGDSLLLDSVIVGLTSAIVSPAALSEFAILACVHSLAAVVHRYDTIRCGTETNPDGSLKITASGSDNGNGSGGYVEEYSPSRGALIPTRYHEHSEYDGYGGFNRSPPTAATTTPHADVDPAVDEAASYYRTVTPSDCFLVMRSVIEAALFPYAVLRALFRCLCEFGGCYGELYASQTIIESRGVAPRAAAAYGLRACGAKAARAIAMAMSDDAAEVRREGFATLESVGIAAVVAVVRSPRRPPEHRAQIVAALRDCLLRDVGRGIRRGAAEELYSQLAAKAPGKALATVASA